MQHVQPTSSRTAHISENLHDLRFLYIATNMNKREYTFMWSFVIYLIVNKPLSLSLSLSLSLMHETTKSMGADARAGRKGGGTVGTWKLR